ncbi:hypothetical protein HK405_006190 [Cladochytrium tenue]|nr:hypothetical protein HK405_006190 [Cladochytrium tenue]
MDEAYPVTLSVIYTPLFGKPEEKVIVIPNVATATIHDIKVAIVEEFKNPAVTTDNIQHMTFRHPRHSIKQGQNNLETAADMELFRQGIASASPKLKKLWEIRFKTGPTTSVPTATPAIRRQPITPTTEPPKKRQAKDDPPAVPLVRSAKKKVRQEAEDEVDTQPGGGTNIHISFAGLERLLGNLQRGPITAGEALAAGLQADREHDEGERSFATVEEMLEAIVESREDRMVYLELFRSHCITVAALKVMSVEMLVGIGVRLGHAAQLIALAKH